MSFYNKKFVIIRLFIYLLVLLAILFFDKGFMDNISLCPLYLLTGEKCFGCGMTRAFIHLMNFDFKGAVAFNPLSVFYFPLGVILVVFDIIKGIRKVLKK